MDIPFSSEVWQEVSKNTRFPIVYARMKSFLALRETVSVRIFSSVFYPGTTKVELSGLTVFRGLPEDAHRVKEFLDLVFNTPEEMQTSA